MACIAERAATDRLRRGRMVDDAAALASGLRVRAMEAMASVGIKSREWQFEERDDREERDYKYLECSLLACENARP